MTFATRITTAGHQSVTVISRTLAITDWVSRYLGLWWTAADVGPGRTPTGPVIRADVDVEQHAALGARVLAGRPDEVTYATAPMLIIRDATGLVTATQPDDGLSYAWDPAAGRMRIVGADETAVATATARLAREVVRGRLLSDGWRILHASAVTRPNDGATLLTLGNKGAGKTTTGFLLARTGLHLLANDRVFARLDGEVVRVLPWPSAAAIGFGLLDALGWYEPVRARARAGGRMHPTQKQKVTDALLAGDRTPLWTTSGAELKPQFFPDQLESWLGLTLATEGHVVGILFPEIVPGAAPAVTMAARGVSDADFFGSATEDRYPDVFGLLPAETSTKALVGHLAQLPHRTLTMNHDPEASTAVLLEAARSVVP